jgi:hypothetical protein
MAGQDNNNNNISSSMKAQPERRNWSSFSAATRARRFHLDRLPMMSGDLSSSSLAGTHVTTFFVPPCDLHQRAGSSQEGNYFCSFGSSRLSRRERVIATLDAAEKILSEGGDLFANDNDSSQGSFLSGRRLNQ